MRLTPLASLGVRSANVGPSQPGNDMTTKEKNI